MRPPEDELIKFDAASLRRHIPDPHDGLIDFASNDYLGLSKHPAIKAVYLSTVEKLGVGATASRLICGTSSSHQELEDKLATAKGTEAAITFATGYATSTGVIPAVLEKGDTIIMDKLCHASLIDGARMSNATIRVFPHSHLGKLEKLLESTAQKTNTRTLVVTESVFSMDGDTTPLAEIVSLCKKYGALLMVDEAHALGVLGETGMGLAEQLGLTDEIDLHMGTLGKAAGVAGGYIAANRQWIDLLINKARSFIYSTAPPPAQMAAAGAALDIIQSEEGRQLRDKLWSNIKQLKQDAQSAIIPWIIGDNRSAMQKALELRSSGFLIPAIRYPTVPRNSARLRISVSAAHSQLEINQLKELID